MMNLKNIMWILLAGLMLSACHKDVDETEEVTTSPPFVPTIVTEVTGDVLGYVYDKDGEPVADAMVSLYSGSTMTNELGIFVFDDQSLDGNGTYIKVEKSGYLLASDMVYPVKGTTYSYVKMLELDPQGSFVASSGGSIPVSGGGSILFAAGSIVDGGGAPYDGAVSVTAYRLAADDPQLGDVMPGGLYARAADGSNVVLGTYGMIAVELRGSSGQELNLADGQTAEVVFPIAVSQQGTAPSEIELWSFDEVEGLWIQDGSAQRVGSDYIAQVSHFSFWNCDAPFPLVQLCGTVVFDDGTPVTSALVYISAEGAGTAFGYTDSDGVYCGKMPKGLELTITVYIPGCADPVAVVTRGPFFNNGTMIDPIILSIGQVSIAGVVVCDGVPVADALLQITAGASSYVRQTDSAGSFDLDLSNQLCGGAVDYSVRAIHPDGRASEVVVVDPGVGGTITLDVCTDCPLAIEIINSPDPCMAFTGSLLAQVTGGSSDVVILWDNGGGPDSVSFYEVPGIYCVSVMDNIEDCMVSKCYEVVFDSLQQSFFGVTATVTSVVTCGQSNGEVELEIFNGTAPFDITWQTENGMEVTALEDQVSGTGLAADLYLITVIDANGCITRTEFFLSDGGGFEIDIINNGDCAFPQLTAIPLGGTAPFTYFWSSSSMTATSETIDASLPDNYVVEVTDANGCISANEIYVNGAFSPSPPDYGQCLELGFFREIITDGLYQSTILSPSGFVLADGIWGFHAHDVIQGGYTIEVVTTNDIGCTSSTVLELPFFDGLSIVTAASGMIDISVDTSASCQSCQPGAAFIYNANFLDVTAQNGTLPAGTYTVVVKEENSDCVIAHQVVTLN